MTARMIYNSRIPRWLGVEAIVLWPWVLFSRPYKETSMRTVRHELIHVAQIKRIGVLRFYLSYLVLYFGFRIYGYSHDFAYTALPHEVEANLGSAGVEG